jgi:hypothetical protein
MKKLGVIAVLVASITAQAQDVKPIKSINDANALIENLRSNAIPQLRGIHQCYVDAQEIVENYRNIKQNWVGKTKSDSKPLIIDTPAQVVEGNYDLNVYRNFDGLGVYQKQFFNELQTFIETYQSDSSDTLDGIQSQILKIDQGQMAFGDKIAEIAKKDSLYLALLAQMKNEANKERARRASQIQDLLASRCKNAGLESIAGFIEADIRSVVENMEHLRGFTLDSIEKRNLIVKNVFQEIRQKHVDEYQILAGEQLRKTGAVATDVLEIAKVGEAMLNWWIAANQNGLAKSLHLKYLQFETPRDLLLLEKQRAAKFDEALRSFKYAPADLSAYYLTRLASFQKTINDNLKTLQDRGWKGQLDRQVLLNTKRKAAPSLSQTCRDSLQKHLDTAALVKKAEQFTAVETLYAVSLSVCQL